MHWLFLHAPLALAAIASARSFSMYSHHESRHRMWSSVSLYYFYSTAIDVTGDQFKLQGPSAYTMANCYWDGSAPFCAGSCDTSNDWVECDKNGSGDRGATCLTGYKRKCCKGSCSSSVHTGELPIRYNYCLDILSAPPCSRFSQYQIKGPRPTANEDPGNAGGKVAHVRGDEPNDDYCDKGYIIVCPPGAKSNQECHCLEDPGNGHHGGGDEELWMELDSPLWSEADKGFTDVGIQRATDGWWNMEDMQKG